MTAAGLTLAEQATLIATINNRLMREGYADLNSLLSDLSVSNVHHHVAEYSFAVDGGGIGAHEIGDDIPAGAIILGGFVEPETTATSATDAGTMALSVVGAGDLKVAVAISAGGDAWDAGARKAIVPKFNTPETTSVKVAVANKIDATIAVEAWTAGKFAVHLFYVMSEI